MRAAGCCSAAASCASVNGSSATYTMASRHGLERGILQDGRFQGFGEELFYGDLRRFDGFVRR